LQYWAQSLLDDLLIMSYIELVENVLVWHGYFGNKSEFEILKIDINRDICVLVPKSIWPGSGIHPAKELPKQGSKLSTVAAPNPVLFWLLRDIWTVLTPLAIFLFQYRNFVNYSILISTGGTSSRVGTLTVRSPFSKFASAFERSRLLS